MCPERTVLRWRATTDDDEHYVYTKPYDGLPEFARNQTVERFLKLREGLSGDVGLRQRIMRQRLHQIIPDIFVSVPSAHLYETTVIHRCCCSREVSKRVTICR